MQRVNKVNGKKSTPTSKLKAASQKERLQKWKQHFKILLGNPPEIIDRPIEEIINGWLDIKLEYIIEDELDAVEFDEFIMKVNVKHFC